MIRGNITSNHSSSSGSSSSSANPVHVGEERLMVSPEIIDWKTSRRINMNWFGKFGNAQLFTGHSSFFFQFEHQVAVRVRPPINLKEEKCIQVFSKKSLYFDDGHNKPKKYMYDYVFAEDSTQDEVYQTTTSPLIKDVLKGYSAAVFAYGATGSGKFWLWIFP